MSSYVWPMEWLRAVCRIAILSVVAEHDTYGYELSVRLRGAGLGDVRGSTLYPILSKLESEGAVTSEWRPGDGGPGRKYYSITSEGERLLDQQRRAWSTFADNANDIIQGGENR